MRRLVTLSAAVLVGGLTWLASWAPLLAATAEEPLIVVVHEQSPVEKLSAYELEALFTRSQTRWSDGRAVYPFSFPAGTPARELFDRVVLRLNPEQVGRFWLDRRIRGLGMPPKQVPSAGLMLQVIANLPGAVGYVTGTRASPGVRVVARIVQGKVVPP
jgi:hypothetical protein